MQGSRSTSWFYRTDGFLDHVVNNALSLTTSFDEYDLVGRVKKVTPPAPSGTLSQISMLYDANGNLTSLTPPGRPAHLFSYDAVDRPDTYTAPTVSGGGDFLTKWQYELDGAPKTLKEPDSTTPRIERVPDTLLPSRVGKIKDYGAGIDTVFNYESTGAKRLQSLDRTGSPSVFALYDGARPKGVQWKSGGTVLGSFEVEHDNHLRVSKQTVTAGSLSSFIDLQYDRDDLLATAGALTLTRHPGSGQLTDVKVAQGGATVSEGRTYNAYGETKTSLTKHKTAAGIETTLLSFDYEPIDAGTTYPRDGLGRIKRKTETEVVSGTSVTTKYRYEYDLAGRLTDVYEDGVLVEHYGYGVNGTRSSVTKGGTTTSATDDDQDRLLTFGGTTYGWTSAGRLASKAVGGTTTNTYAYDSQGNLLTVTGTPVGTINYVIDPLGRRVGRTAGGTTRRWFYSGSLRIVGELDPAGATLTQYVYGTHPNVPEYAIRGTQVYRLVTDHLGSLRLVVRVSDQTIVQRMEYDAFGVVGTDYIAPGWDALPFGFAGGLYDRDTKLVRFGARDYESETGRWTAKDPIGFAGGLSNLYEYAGDDPVNRIDPRGLYTHSGGWRGVDLSMIEV